MSSFGITETSYRLLMGTFSNYPEIEEVIIFGSRAKGTCKKGSDIDLAIKGDLCTSLLALDLQAHFNVFSFIHFNLICAGDANTLYGRCRGLPFYRIPRFKRTY